MAKKLRVGSRAWEIEISKTLTFAKGVVETHLPGAMAGKAESTEAIVNWIEKWPELREMVPALDVMATKAEREWVSKLAGGNKLSEKAIWDEIAVLKASLLPQNPSELETILANTVVVARLSYQYTAWLAAQVSEYPAVNASREHRLGVATKRMYAAIKQWELYMSRKAKGARPNRPLKIFEPDTKAG